MAIQQTNKQAHQQNSKQNEQTDLETKTIDSNLASFWYQSIHCIFHSISMQCNVFSGHFSRFWIQSVDVQGQLKTRGGDSWRVYVKQGPASIAPVIIDHQNGLYEVLMLFTEPGVYVAEIVLEFTLCDAFRDPPENWFRIGKYMCYQKG